LECEAIGAAMAVLHNASGVEDVAAFGNSIHILVEDARTALEDLPTLLSGHGIAVTRFERIAPTIEDIFVQLIGSGSESEGPRP